MSAPHKAEVEMKKCEFTQTYTGICDQEAMLNNSFCYYHNKVAMGYIEREDQLLLIKGLPSIKSN